MSTVRRILLLSDLVPPHFSPRIVALLKRLPAAEWSVDVVSEQIDFSAAQAHGHVDAHSLDAEETYIRIDRVKLTTTGWLGRLRSLSDALRNSKSRRLLTYIHRHYDLSQYDLLVGMSYRTFPLPAVARLAAESGLPCLMDCRDIVEEYTPCGYLPAPLPSRLPLRPYIYRWLRSRFISARTRALDHATTISTVSEWHRDTLRRLHPDRRVVCIPNGYDETLFVAQPHIPSLPLRIVYTGRLLSIEMRDPTLLYEALSTPSLLSAIEAGTVELHWYTDSASQVLLERELGRYPVALREAHHFHEMVSFEEVPRLLSEADVILLLGNREAPDGPHGMVTTKLFEAMAMLRPILMVRSDESVVAREIEKHGNSCAGESVEEVALFLEQQLSRIRAGLATMPSQFTTAYQQYTREAMARSFVEEFHRLSIES